MVRFALVLGFCALLSPSALAEKRVALVIGIDKYDNLGPNAQLEKARSDATAVAGVLGNLGYDVIAADDVTRSAFNNRWQDFLNRLAPGDTAAFYFAGHGVEFGGRSYLLPRDVPNIKPGRDELLRREALSLQEFLADLRDRGTRLNVVVLDACRENPFEQLAGRSAGGRRGLATAEPPPEGTFIMYSAGAGESALDRLNNTDRDPNSVYTRHLLPLLRTPGLPLTEVAEQVRLYVRQTAATVQHRQTPAYYSQVLGRVCLAGGDCGPRVAAAPAQKVPSEQRVAMLKAEEARKGPEVEALSPGRAFRDCPDVCPEMVAVPAGSFRMGSLVTEQGRDKTEGPERKVTIARPFAVGKFEVTFAEWDACVAAGGCYHVPDDRGWGRGRRPVIGVSWNDAKEYTAWLSGKTGKTYRLLSEAEWEYAGRARTTTRYAFGDDIKSSQAQYSRDKTVEVGSFPPNRFGLHDMFGNVWEWVEDNWHGDYQGAPIDGSVWQGGDASRRILRGGGWRGSVIYDLRSANRGGNSPDTRTTGIGFRVARTL